MPAFAADLHTDEGRARGTFVTLLTGTYRQHRHLGAVRDGGGLSAVREWAHERGVVQPASDVSYKSRLFT